MILYTYAWITKLTFHFRVTLALCHGKIHDIFKVAAEKAPIRDPAVRAIRAAYNQAKSEFATALAPEKQKVISVFVIKCTAISDA